jgi:hypothetical protein
MTYQIKDWNEHFENNRSKAIVNTDWVPIPNKQDGDGYTELMADKNGTLFLGCWIALVELASKCHPRGTLVRSDGRPHDLPSISRITRVPEAILKQSLPKLISIGWIITSDTASGCHQMASGCHQMASGCIEGREGIEGKGMEDDGMVENPLLVETDLSNLLYSLIKTRNPGHKEPNISAWAKEVDKMIRIDKRTPEQIKAVINWCQQDSFWQNNILSTAKLREQYDKLFLKMKQSKPIKEVPECNFPTAADNLRNRQ